jgi:3-methyladenine DNA glycosylase AlkD
MTIPRLAAALGADLARLRVRTTPSVRRLRRDWSRRLAAAPASVVLELAERLVGQGEWERFIAYELVAGHAPASDALNAARLRRLGRGLTSWGAVDCFGCYLAGPAWRRGQVPTRLIERWARSHDRWWRRAALVTTVALNVRARGGTGDVRRTLRICRLLVDDRDDMVVKGLSWALRALVPHEPRAVAAFLVRHRERLAARVRREVEYKLRTD